MLQATALFVLATLCFAQSPDPATRFEVVSIKPATEPGPGGIRHLNGGRLQAEKVPLRFLIQYAYDIAEERLEGGEKWISTDRFDIVATPERDAGSEPLTRDRALKLMIREMLGDRFKLQLTPQTREMKAFELTRSGSDHKLTPVPLGPQPGFQVRSNGSLRVATFKNAPMPYIAMYMSAQLKRPVIDKTGLTGAFDFTLQWAADLDVDATSDVETPSIYTAVEKQLGLKIRDTRAPVQIFLITHAERPSEN
jgi:uncharacterized protein (TIGR03435 family)